MALVSTAVTAHFLIGAIVVANLPKLYRRFGVPAVTKAGALALGTGVTGWAVAQEPWQLFAATLLSGAGWVAMGAAAVNADRLALVRAHAPGGARHGLQWRERWRHRVLTAVGRRDRRSSVFLWPQRRSAS